MLKINRGWLVVAAALAVGASGVARADDGGDNGMNPMYGDSYAAHEMDGQTTPLMDQMRQTQAAIAARTHAAAERMRTALNPTSSAGSSTTTSSTSVSASPSTAAPSTVDTSQQTTDSGYRIAP